jgi:restriction endonuclease-like protein
MNSFRRIPIDGWQRCVHNAAAFDSEGEFRAACLLDAAQRVEWWIRNEPALLRIPTPAGYFEPDFIYRILSADGPMMAVLEIKGAIFWDGQGSMARIKAEAACSWTQAIAKSDTPERWSFAVVLDQDARSAPSLEAMLATAQRSAP